MSKCCDSRPKPLGITGCQSNWYALFTSLNCKDNRSWKTPIAAWLLVDSNGYTHAHPMVALSGDVCDATLVNNYVGVIAPGDSSAEIELLEAAKTEFRQLKTDIT